MNGVLYGLLILASINALALVVWYLYARLAKRIDDLQELINQMHVDHQKQSTAALVGVSTALDGLQQAVKQIGSSSGGYRKQA